MSNKPTEYSLQTLKNLSADMSVSPPIPREGILGKSTDGTWRDFPVEANIHTGNNEVRVYQENHICTGNTTTTPLAAGATFTGEWQDCLNYQEVNISVDTDQNSATNGLVIQWSADGITVADTDSFSIYANSGTNYTPNPAFRYVRVTYTNGAIPQTRFNLMTILRRGVTGGSFHRIDSTLRDDSDGRLNLSVLKLRTAANNYVSATATNAGNFKVSIQEFDEAVATNVNKLNVASHLVDENSVQSQALGDIYFTGAQVTVDAAHHEIHCGNMVSLCYTSDLTNGEVRDILILLPNPANTAKKYHFAYEIASEAEADFKFYEGTTVSANGTALSSYNRNRQDPVVVPANEVGFYHTPTVTGVGTLICEDHWGSGRSGGGSNRETSEWVLKKNEKYLLRITNDTATNNYISVKINYYVHPGV